MEYDIGKMSTSSMSAGVRFFAKFSNHILQHSFAFLVNAVPNHIFQSVSYLWFTHVNPVFQVAPEKKGRFTRTRRPIDIAKNCSCNSSIVWPAVWLVAPSCWNQRSLISTLAHCYYKKSVSEKAWLRGKASPFWFFFRWLRV